MLRRLVLGATNPACSCGIALPQFCFRLFRKLAPNIPAKTNSSSGARLLAKTNSSYPTRTLVGGGLQERSLASFGLNCKLVQRHCDMPHSNSAIHYPKLLFVSRAAKAPPREASGITVLFSPCNRNLCLLAHIKYCRASLLKIILVQIG